MISIPLNAVVYMDDGHPTVWVPPEEMEMHGIDVERKYHPCGFEGTMKEAGYGHLEEKYRNTANGKKILLAELKADTDVYSKPPMSDGERADVAFKKISGEWWSYDWSRCVECEHLVRGTPKRCEECGGEMKDAKKS